VPRLPDGEAAPIDGALPPAALDALRRRPLGVYVHVPFCAVRCGYCDFNTYVPGEDGDDRASFVAAALAEIALARRVLGDGAPPVGTVFFGGGTPTLLHPGRLGTILAAIHEGLGVEAGAEVTVEANPETVDEATFAALRDAGFTRVSLGMQSARARPRGARPPPYPRAGGRRGGPGA
jgi:oxygen-independent coproporphyrinogen-3 oxidase